MTNHDLVTHLIHTGVLHSPRIIAAFSGCDRIHFVPSELRALAYEDHPLSIGEGQTISQPYTVAFMLELLRPEEGNRILDIGSGSGWTMALLAHCVGVSGYVEGLERLDELVRFGQANLRRCGITNASIAKASSHLLGKPEHHYDRILVSASADDLPQTLFNQLEIGGILVIPIQNSIWRFVKHSDGKIRSTEYPGFRFVPLIISE